VEVGFPPVLHSLEYQDPVPASGPIHTAGSEDSPFITPDGRTFLFFFTPDVRVPAERQLLDGARGIYISSEEDGIWSEPQRVILNDPGELSLDGCPFLQGETFWLCSARTGNFRGVDLWTAEYTEGEFNHWSEPDLIVSQFAAKPTLDEAGNLYFVHHYCQDGVMIEADVYMARRK